MGACGRTWNEKKEEWKFFIYLAWHRKLREIKELRVELMRFYEFKTPQQLESSEGKQAFSERTNESDKNKLEELFLWLAILVVLLFR